MARSSARRTSTSSATAGAGSPDDTLTLPVRASTASSWIGSPCLWASIAVMALAAACLLLFTAQDGMAYFEATGRKNYATIVPPTIRPTLMNVFPHDPLGTAVVILLGLCLFPPQGDHH